MHILRQLVTDLLDDFPYVAIDLNLDSKAAVDPVESARVLQHLISAGYTVTQDGGATDCVLVTHWDRRGMLEINRVEPDVTHFIIGEPK